MATTARQPATEADLLAQPEDGFKRELVDGEIRVSPAGSRHGIISVRLSARLFNYAEAKRLGHVLDAQTGFRLPGGNVRLPDVAFVARGRFPDDDKPPESFSPVPPDLAIEVLSPGDRPREILDKVGEYLGAGVRLVWVVDPAARTVTVHRALNDVRTLRADDHLDGEDVLPGFRCPLAAIF